MKLYTWTRINTKNSLHFQDQTRCTFSVCLLAHCKVGKLQNIKNILFYEFTVFKVEHNKTK